MIVLLIVNAASVLFMAGVGWLVQAVAYPLFAFVDGDSFPAFHAEWSKRIAPVVIVPMTLDLVTSAWIAISPPEGIGTIAATAGAILAAVTWASTALLQVPRHEELSAGFDRGAHERLVRSSWVRTLGWSSHAVLCCLMLSSVTA